MGVFTPLCRVIQRADKIDAFTQGGTPALGDEVSTTCGSGWVNQSSQVVGISNANHHPPATAGGTDLMSLERE